MTAKAAKPRGRRKLSGGQILVLTCFAIVSTLAIAAFAVDVGLLWNTRRHMQTAADAGAIAGAWDLIDSNSANLTTDAKNETSQNGFTDGSSTTVSASTVSVTVASPPTSGNFKSNNSAVYVSISQNQPTQFLKFVGYTSIPMSVSAVAIVNGSNNCIYALDPSKSKTINIAGTATFSATCSIYDNSQSSSALVAGGGGTISVPSIGVVGGTTVNGGASIPYTSGISSFNDPLSGVAAPTYTDTCNGSFKGVSYGGGTSAQSITLNPEEICGGLSIGNNATVTFNPGLYVINGGGIKITGGNVSGTGVTFYLTGKNGNGASPKDYGGVTINGGTVNFSAPCSASSSGFGTSIAGLLFFQDRSISSTANNGSSISGASGSSFDGALYFPTTALTYQGTSSSNGYTIIIADTVNFTGNTTVGDNYSCLPNGHSLIQTASLAQ